MKISKLKKTASKDRKVLIKFLQQTKEGKFAPIERSGSKYSRLEETIESINVPEENYYYSLY